MKNTMLAATAASIIAIWPADTIARQTLSEADREKIVCVPERDVHGAMTSDKVCMTGAKWQAALLKEQRRRSRTFAENVTASRRNEILTRPFGQFVSTAPAKPF